MVTETIDSLYLEQSKFKSIKSIIEYMYPANEQYCIRNTYYDKECSKIQCTAKRRSINDLILIVRSYFSKAPVKKILQVLEDCNLHFYHCNSVERIVFHRVKDTPKFNKENFISYSRKNRNQLFNYSPELEKSVRLISKNYGLS